MERIENDDIVILTEEEKKEILESLSSDVIGTIEYHINYKNNKFKDLFEEIIAVIERDISGNKDHLQECKDEGYTVEAFITEGRLQALNELYYHISQLR